MKRTGFLTWRDRVALPVRCSFMVVHKIAEQDKGKKVASYLTGGNARLSPVRQNYNDSCIAQCVSRSIN
jgi:hypothetical protein